MALILTEFRKALDSLKDAASRPLDDDNIVRDSVIQRFEYTYELAWKLMQRWLKNNLGAEAVDPLSKKDLFRLAAQKGLISDPVLWFKYHEARNIVSHTYDERNAASVYQAAVQFSKDAEDFFKELDGRND